MKGLSRNQDAALALLYRLERDDEPTSFYYLQHKVRWPTLLALASRKLVTGKFPDGAISGTCGSMVWRLTDAAKPYARSLHTHEGG